MASSAPFLPADALGEEDPSPDSGYFNDDGDFSGTQDFSAEDQAAPDAKQLKTPLPMQKRRRVTRACDECRRKKIKCDGKQPCTHCTVYSYGKASVHQSLTLLTLTFRMFLRSALESPPQSRAAICRSPRKSLTQGKCPPPCRSPRLEPRRSTVRCACNRAAAASDQARNTPAAIVATSHTATESTVGSNARHQWLDGRSLTGRIRS